MQSSIAFAIPSKTPRFIKDFCFIFLIPFAYIVLRQFNFSHLRKRKFRKPTKENDQVIQKEKKMHFHSKL